VDTSTAAGDEQQRKRVADDEGSDEEGGKGDGNGDEGGGRATATTVKKRARAARAMVTRVVGDEEGTYSLKKSACDTDQQIMRILANFANFSRSLELRLGSTSACAREMDSTCSV